MTPLLRTISAKKIVGWIFCKGLGLLPCETMGDKKKLYALCQIVLEALHAGRITLAKSGMFQFDAARTTPTEARAAEDLMEYARLNCTIPPPSKLCTRQFSVDLIFIPLWV